MEAKTQIFDLHCDTLDRLAWPLLPQEINGGSWFHGPNDDEFLRPGELGDFKTNACHLSLENMSQFAWTQCLAVFIPDGLTPEQSAQFFEVVSQTLPIHVQANPELLAVARDAAEIQDILNKGQTAGLLTIEGGTLLAAAPDMCERIAQAGVKMLTLTWNGANPLGSGNQTSQGLTAFGRRIIGELEDRKIVVDVSHLNDQGFEDLLKTARRPFAASHSNSREICNVPRNLTDDQFRAIRDSGGIVGLNFFNIFLSQEHEDPTKEDMLAHIEHWLDLDGHDTVALGSDYDGCDVASWLNPCSKVADLAQLFEKHFGKELAEKILFKNAHEFFLRNERD